MGAAILISHCPDEQTTTQVMALRVPQYHFVPPLLEL
jgi:hypothetical protein